MTVLFNIHGADNRIQIGDTLLLDNGMQIEVHHLKVEPDAKGLQCINVNGLFFDVNGHGRGCRIVQVLRDTVHFEAARPMNLGKILFETLMPALELAPVYPHWEALTPTAQAIWEKAAVDLRNKLNAMPPKAQAPTGGYPKIYHAGL
jgi:hypothetical protein